MSSFLFVPSHSLKLIPIHAMVTPSAAAHPIHRAMLACPIHQGIARSSMQQRGLIADACHHHTYLQTQGTDRLEQCIAILSFATGWPVLSTLELHLCWNPLSRSSLAYRHYEEKGKQKWKLMFQGTAGAYRRGAYANMQDMSHWTSYLRCIMVGTRLDACRAGPMSCFLAQFQIFFFESDELMDHAEISMSREI